MAFRLSTLFRMDLENRNLNATPTKSLSETQPLILNVVQRNLRLHNVAPLSLFALAFFWVSGGIYGNEVILRAAPLGF